MVKYFIGIVVVGFLILYGIQIAVYHSVEEIESTSIPISGSDSLKATILLGDTPKQKYIPGSGFYSVFTEEPCRLELRFRDQVFTEPLAKRKDVDLKSIKPDFSWTYDKLYVRIEIKFQTKLFEFKLK